MDLYGEPLKKMFEAPVQLAMPNLRLPAFNDSAETPVRNGLYELAYARYRDPVYLTALAAGNRRNEYALWFGVDPLPGDSPASIKSYNATDSGYAILARGTGQSATWLCLKYGPHGGGHGHPDKNNFVLYAGGKVVFPDPGTRPYGSPLHAEWDRVTMAHNTLVIDQASQAQSTGRILAFGDDFAMTDAGSIYPGVRFIRTAALLSQNLIVFVDRVTADRDRTFDLANHFAGTWAEPSGGSAISLGTSAGYQHVRDATVRHADGISLRTTSARIVLAPNEPTDVITGTGVGTSTEDRVPMSIFRRRGRETTYVWAVSLDGSPVTLGPAATPGGVTVRAEAGAARWEVAVDMEHASVRVTAR
jgi:hypothetical protein